VLRYVSSADLLATLDVESGSARPPDSHEPSGRVAINLRLRNADF
jgi:hypothetical protein